jgi:hypothetical protein
LLVVMLAQCLVGASLAEDDDWDDDDWGDEGSLLPVEFHGFVEGAMGFRVVDNPVLPDDFVLGEGRFQLEVSHEREFGRLNVKTDFNGDAVGEEFDIDLREAIVFLAPAEWLEVQGGWQVLTWGTGDFLFLNDLFAKDFVSFFNGRADEYLKAPNAGVKVSLFSALGNLDFVWIPIFESDRGLTGERLSFFNPQIPGLQGDDPPFESLRPDKTLDNGEFALRLHRNLGGAELALYSYWGFFPQPTAFDIDEALPTHSRLGAYGASFRDSWIGGVGNLEFAYYDSADDRGGDDPLVPNSQLRALVGFEREVLPKFNVGIQYYLEATLDHDLLIANSPNPEFEPDEIRHLLTTRFTYLTLRDDLVLSLFVFVSPSDVDAHLRPSLSYKFSDEIQLDAGFNIMVGREQHTFFGQLEENTNFYTRMRYTF